MTPKIQTLFYVVASCGLLLNLSFDYLAYRRIDISDNSGSSVIQSYEMMLHFQRLDQAIDRVEKQSPAEASQNLALVLKEIDHAKELAKDQPTYLADLQKITNLVQQTQSKKSSTDLETTVHQMASNEAEVLKNKMLQDTSENLKIRHTLIRALTLDLGLVVVMLILFFSEFRNRNSVEKNLRTTLKSLREIIQTLEQREEKRMISSRTIVHDIKNPLGSIHGLASLISDEAASKKTVQEFSELIQKISTSTLQLVESLLIPNGESNIPMEKLNFTEILNEICIQAEVQAKNKHQTLIKEFPEKEFLLQGNRQKLEELCFNLIGNAIKYAPEDSQVWVRCHEDHHQLVVEVEDQGPGFSSKDKEKAFKFGQTLSARPTGNESATGYGLFTAKQVVEQHSGQIEIATPSKGVGACVRFSLPLSDKQV